ncbi:hypothetical protein BS47DRAFT_1365502 [Hydnum rufescens UP504]|uniref:Uncharacterized protein n=1 Tax=Hydnum rufescens UP504 TaxID=1448309 RepID=A0A9P6ANR0_9AGAM|nr:hypothetical protein BS47DRAFT_1365502 [Hydnum rufescens UP504]
MMNQVWHCTPTSAGSSSLCPKNTQTTSTAKYGSAQLLKTPSPSIPNLSDNKTSMVPHTHFSRVYNDTKRAALAALLVFSLHETPIRSMHQQCLGEIRVCVQPPKTPTLDYPQPIQRDLKYGATHPLQWSRFFLPPRNCPEECTDNTHHEIWECAAAQDLNPRPSASYTMTVGVATLCSFSLHETDPKNAQTMTMGVHTRPRPPDIQISTTHTTMKQVQHHTPTSVFPFVKPTSDKRTDKAQVKCAHVRSHTRSHHSTIGNQYNDETYPAPHTRFSSKCTDPTQGKLWEHTAAQDPLTFDSPHTTCLLQQDPTTQYPTRQMHKPGLGQNMGVCSLPDPLTLE